MKYFQGLYILEEMQRPEARRFVATAPPAPQGLSVDIHSNVKA